MRSIEDGNAAQGNGEVSGTVIESLLYLYVAAQAATREMFA